MHQWFITHPGRSVEDPTAHSGQRWENGPYPRIADMPWTIARRAALQKLQVFTWETTKRWWRVLREIEPPDPKSTWFMKRAETEEELRASHSERRRGVIRAYRLEGLVSESD